MRKGRVAAALGAGLMSASVASAQHYQWIPWTGGGTTASATDTRLGTATLTCSPGRSVLAPFQISFDSVGFVPTTAESACVGVTAPFLAWNFVVDFSAVPDTNNVTVGIGNFGHGFVTYPGYQLSVVPAFLLSQITVLQSCDHTWSSTLQHFNDDVTIDPFGNFVVATVPGLDDHNSDILLLSLPPGVVQLKVSSKGPSAGDSINVVISPACPCLADYDGSGGVPDANDIAAFFADWLAGAVDPDCSGGTPDMYDIDVFFQQWLYGC